MKKTFHDGYIKGSQERKEELVTILYYILCKNMSTVDDKIDYERIYEEVLELYTFLQTN